MSLQPGWVRLQCACRSTQNTQTNRSMHLQYCTAGHARCQHHTVMVQLTKLLLFCMCHSDPVPQTHGVTAKSIIASPVLIACVFLFCLAPIYCPSIGPSRSYLAMTQMESLMTQIVTHGTNGVTHGTDGATCDTNGPSHDTHKTTCDVKEVTCDPNEATCNTNEGFCSIILMALLHMTAATTHGKPCGICLNTQDASQQLFLLPPQSPHICVHHTEDVSSFLHGHTLAHPLVSFGFHQTTGCLHTAPLFPSLHHCSIW